MRAQARQQPASGGNCTIAGADSLTAEREGGREGGREGEREAERERERKKKVRGWRRRMGLLGLGSELSALPTRCRGAGGVAGRIRCFRESCTRYAASWGEFAGSPS
jgi:hypothetical protein